MSRLRLTRRSAATLVTALLVAGVALGGLVQLRVDTSPTTFVPEDDPSVTSLADAAGSFGGDPLVVLAESAKRKRLLDPEQLPLLLRLEGRLAQLPDVKVVYGPATLLNQVASSMQNLLASLSGQRDALRARAVAEAKKKGVVSRAALDTAGDRATRTFDLRYGKLLVRGLPAGLPTLRNQRFVDRVIFSKDETPRAQWHFVVPSAQAVSILVRPREGLSQAGVERLVASVREAVDDAGLDTEQVVVTGAPGITAGLGEQVRVEAPRLGLLALVCVAACYFLVPWTRRRRDRLVPLGVTLVSTCLVLAGFGWLGLSLSLGVIAFLPILLGIASDFPAYLAQPGARRPVVVVATASAAAFAALAFSPIPFIRELGLALAAGQLLAVGLMLLVRHRHEPAPEPADGAPASVDSPRSPRRRGLVAVVAAAIALVGWFSLHGMQVQAEPQKLAAGLDAIQDAEHAERVFGGAGEVQILVSGRDVTSPQAMSWMRRAQNQVVVEHGSTFRPVLSPPSLLGFLGDDPSPRQIAAAVQLLPSYLTAAVLTDNRQRASMSFQVGLQDLGEQEQLIRDVRHGLPPLPPGLDADVVGMPVVAARGYDLVAGDRYLISLAGIVAAALVLLLGMPRRSDAARAAFASVLATGWGLALATSLGVDLTPLTVGLGSLTTAIACEYAVMLAHHSAGNRMRKTVLAAAAAAATGYLTLAASELAALREFGLVLAATVVLSLGAAHLVVRLFPPRAATEPSPEAAETTEPTRELELL